MSKEITNLNKYFKNLENFKLPNYEEFPPIELYMEQVVGYISNGLKDFYGNNENIITPFMVNNYVKAKIINPPNDKKYNREHIAYLVAISLLKSVVPMRDIATFIDLDKNLTNNVSSNRNLYDFFKEIQEETLHQELHKSKIRLDVLSKTNHKKTDKQHSEEEIEKLNLSYIALRLYIQSETTKQIADAIMKEVSSSTLPKDLLEETRREVALTNRKVLKEAKKVGNRK